MTLRPEQRETLESLAPLSEEMAGVEASLTEEAAP